MPLGGAGAILKLKLGDLQPETEPGTQVGLDAAKAYAVAVGGVVHMGPGLDALVLGTTGWGGAHPAAAVSLVRYANEGIFLSRFHMADGADPTRVVYWDLTSVATGTERTITLPNWSGLLALPVDAGTSGFYLRSNGAGVQPSWQAVSLTNALLDGTNHTDTLAGAVAAGDLIFGNATPKWARLGIGSAGQVLTVVGGVPTWSGTGATALEHNTLAHIKPFSAANCTWTNGSANISTTGSAFANVKVGDYVITGTNATAGNLGRKVTVWTDANNITVDSTNTGSTLSGVTLYIQPGDHYDDTIASDGTGTGVGYLMSYSKGNFSQTGPGTTFQEIRGPFRWMSPGNGSISSDFRFQGSTSTASPFGFCLEKSGTTNRAYFHVNDLAAGAVVLRLGNPASGDFFVYTNLQQTLISKVLDTTIKIKMDGTTTYGVFQNGSAADRLSFDFTGVTALRAITWPDYAGRVRLERAHVTFADGDTSPTVAGSRLFKTANTGATSITTFDDAIAGQQITIIIGDANTTLVDGATLVLAGSANWTPAATDTWSGVYDGTAWYETGRSDNS